MGDEQPMLWWHFNQRSALADRRPSSDAYQFHLSLDGYAPTPLVELPSLTTQLKCGRLLAKDESHRLGLPAFKALGASWAIECALRDRRSRVPTTLTTASDGNHGRAVAHFARRRGQRAQVFVPRGVHPAARQAIVDEGAELYEVDGSYDDAVSAAQTAALAEGCLLIQDTAWDGYEEVPAQIVDGYATMFIEIDDQLSAMGCSGLDLIVVPVGVGSLLHACLLHYRTSTRARPTAVVAVEPETAAALAPSLEAGRPVTVATQETIMAGLNCGTPSALAWPAIQDGLDAVVTVPDQAAVEAIRDLTAAGVAAGPCGAAGLAGLRRVLTGSDADVRRSLLGLGSDATIVLLVTEGAEANPAGNQNQQIGAPQDINAEDRGAYGHRDLPR